MKPDKQVYSDALFAFGCESQINQTIEECAELIVAINHWKRSKNNKAQVCEEIADVLIMMQQMMLVFGEYDVKSAILRKKKRLRDSVEQAMDKQYIRSQDLKR